jgi:hypothetical protein
MVRLRDDENEGVESKSGAAVPEVRKVQPFERFLADDRRARGRGVTTTGRAVTARPNG